MPTQIAQGAPSSRVNPSVLTSALVAFVIHSVALSATELITDRPDVTESAVAVPAGSVQVEIGWTTSKNGSFRGHDIGQTLARIGLSDRFELRIGWAGYSRSFRRWGAGDISVGAKMEVWGDSAADSRGAILVSSSLPTGSDGFSERYIQPSALLSVAHVLSDNLSLGANAGARAFTLEKLFDGKETEFIAMYSVSLGAGLGDRTAGFIEFFGERPLTIGEFNNGMDAGLTVLLAPTAQLDAAIGLDLDNTDDRFVTLGISFLMPESL